MYLQHCTGLENMVLNSLHFILENEPRLALNCLRKYNQVPPMLSREIGELLKSKGSPELSIEYLEYLSLEYQIQDPKYHTELAHSYLLLIKH
jgi:hypothetical protein